MSNSHHTKIHFEIIQELSRGIINNVYGKPGTFCDVINEIDTVIKETKDKPYKAFIHDMSCQIYLDEIHKHIYGKSIFNVPINKLRAAFWEIYLPYLFNSYGKKVFRLSPNITHMFLETDLKKIDTFFLQLPYKCIYLALPKEIKLLNTYDIPINGFYVGLLHQDEVVYTKMSEKYHHFQDKKGVKNLMLVAVSDIILPPNDPRETLYYWHIIIEEGDLFKQLNTYLHTWLETVKPVDKKSNLEFMTNIFSFVINSILYINSSGDKLAEEKPKISNVNKIKNISKKRKAQKRTQLPFITLGKDITLDHHYTQIINMSEKRRAEYNKHKKQWLVRGHWRNQAVGSKRSKRKLTWIQPYVKGEKFGEFINKEYNVK